MTEMLAMPILRDLDRLQWLDIRFIYTMWCAVTVMLTRKAGEHAL